MASAHIFTIIAVPFGHPQSVSGYSLLTSCPLNMRDLISVTIGQSPCSATNAPHYGHPFWGGRPLVSFVFYSAKRSIFRTTTLVRAGHSLCPAICVLRSLVVIPSSRFIPLGITFSKWSKPSACRSYFRKRPGSFFSPFACLIAQSVKISTIQI